MTFYFQPPVGNAAYQKLEEYALNRLRFLIRLNSCKTDDDLQDAVLDPEMVGWSDCLIAGTAKDRISHFILRQGLGCSTDTSRFVGDAETRLFRMRLDTFSLEEWVTFFTSLRKDLSRYQSEVLDKLSLFYQALKNNGSESMASTIEGIMAKDEARYIRLPFQLVFSLIAKRQVILNQGQAIIPLSRLPDVLEELFRGILGNMTILHQVSLQQQRNGEIKSAGDVRMMRLAAILKRAYFGESCPTFNSPWKNAKVKAVRLDTLAACRRYFPPCMARLMADLESRYRLPHHDRIRLTLFLKELGLPVHEALLFWKREYSKTPNAGSSSNSRDNVNGKSTSTTTGSSTSGTTFTGTTSGTTFTGTTSTGTTTTGTTSTTTGTTSTAGGTNGVGCRHFWQGNERRYTYSIRHLYGLEGKRLSYAAHSCVHIQESDRGGCPFKSLEVEESTTTTAINDFLTKEEIRLGQSDIEDIVSHVKNRCIDKACGLFMRSKLSKSVSTTTSGDHRLSSCGSGLRNKQPRCTSVSCQGNAGSMKESRPQEVLAPHTLKKSCTSISCQRNSKLTRESRPQEVYVSSTLKKPRCTSISCQRNSGLTRESRLKEVFVPSTLKKSCTSIFDQRNSELTRESRLKEEVAKKASDSNTNMRSDSVEMKETGLRLFTEDMVNVNNVVIGVGGRGGSGESKTHFDSYCSCSCSGDSFKFSENSGSGIFSDNSVVISRSSSSSSSSLEVERKKEETATTVMKNNYHHRHHHHIRDKCEESERKNLLPVCRHCHIISNDEFNYDKQIIPPRKEDDDEIEEDEDDKEDEDNTEEKEEEDEDDKEEEVVAVVVTTTGRTTTTVNQNHSSSSGVRLSLKTEFHNSNGNNDDEGSGGRRRKRRRGGCESECDESEITMSFQSKKKKMMKKHELHDLWRKSGDDTSDDNDNDNNDNNSNNDDDDNNGSSNNNNDNGEKKKKICAATGYFGHETKPSHFFWSLKKAAMAAVLDS